MNTGSVSEPSEEHTRRRRVSRALPPGAPLDDLVKLTTLPAWWSGSPPGAIAEGLRDLLAGMLAPDTVSVELRDPSTGEPVDAPAGALPAAASTAAEASTHGGRAVRLARFPVGPEGELGTLTVGSRRPGFPSRTERVLLWMVASQAALALQRASLATVGRLAEELFVRASAVRAAAKARRGRTEQLLTTIYVELRAPLDDAAACLERLDADASPGDGQRAGVGRLRAIQRQLQEIAADVLVLARLEDGSIHLVPAEVSVDESLAWVEEALRPRLEAKRLRLERVGMGGGAAVRADPERLRQVLASLLSGAATRTAPGGSVRLDCTVGEDTVEMRVRCGDSGVVEEPAGPDGPGWGAPAGAVLGAAVDRALATAMGGDVRVERGADGVAVWTLVLPRTDPRPPGVDGRTSSAPADAGAATGPGEPAGGGAT